MSASELVVGLDIGTTKICAVVGDISEAGAINIVGIGHSDSSGLRKGVIVNIEETVKAIRRAVEDAQIMAGCEIHSVYSGIAGKHILGIPSQGVIAIKGGEVSRNDIERVHDAAKAVVIPADREVIHILPQEYIVDDQKGIADPMSMAGVRLEVKVHIVTGTASSYQNIVRACNRAGLEVAGIALESLASAEAVLTEEEKEIGVALVDLGGGTSDTIIYVENAVRFTSVLSLGGQNVTNDIAVLLRTPMSAAEKIKLKYGCALSDLVTDDDLIEVPSVGGRESACLSRSKLTDICEPRMEEILGNANKELEKSGCKRKLGAGVVLTGGSAMMEGCVELAEQVFDLPVRLGFPREIGGLRDMVNHPKFATAVGLLRYGAAEIHDQDGARRDNTRNEQKTKGLLGKFADWVKSVT